MQFWSIMPLSAIFWLIMGSHGLELLTPQRSSGDDFYPAEDHLALQRQPSSEFSGTPGFQQASCTPHRVEQHNSTCKEQNFDYPHGIVKCINGNITLAPCYCLSNDSSPLLGYCQFTCFRISFLTSSSISSLVKEQCKPFNRRGKFCGRCITNTSYPVYSFSLKCVRCEWNWRNVVKYVALAYGPLSIFLLLLMAFRVSVNSAPLLGFIFVSQICCIPFQMRIATGMIESGYVNGYRSVGLHILGTVYGIWNLDFFRSIIPPFCIHPQWATIQVMCLDYIIASYPCVLILLTYTTVEFYSRGYKIFSWWKPFHLCLTRLRNGMNIKTSLVDAFGTFFSLSYSKTLNTTFDILAITKTWNKDGNEGSPSLYYDATDHIHPLFVSLGLLLFITFNVLPIAVLLIHSLRKPPQQALVHNEIPDDERRFFQPLLNTLLASYRDGSDGGRNCRFFSIVYLTVRIIIVGTLMLTPNIFFQLVAAIILLATGMLVAVIKPYKFNAYNTVDTVLMLSMALSYTGVAAYYFAHYMSPTSLQFAQHFSEVVCNIPFLYIVLLMQYYFIMVSRLPQRAVAKVSKWLSILKTVVRRVRIQRSPRYEVPVNIRGAGTMYVAIESGTVRVSNVDLCH